MANNIVQVKRTSTSGRTPNTTGSYATNSQYISAGELALNMTDGIMYSSNGSAVIEIGANNTNLNTSGNLSLTVNNKQLRFATVNTSAYSIFVQQNDDNFVFYTTNTAYGQRAVWSIYANSVTSNLNFSVPVNFSANVGALTSNGSTGSAGQYLTSNGSSTYWSTPGAASVNTSAQYTWTNTHTFQANVSFTGNGIGITSNTGAIYFNSLSDANWKIGRNTGGTTKFFYTNNTLDIIAANSSLEGIALGFTGNSYLETGYAGTFTRNPIYVGNASVNLAINSTSITGNNITIASPNTAVFYNYNGQVNASAGAFLSNAYAALGGYGGNYLALGQQTNYHQWIQSGFSSAATPVYYSIVLNPLGGNVGIGNTAPTDKLSVNGTTFIGGNLVISTTAGLSANGGYGSSGQFLTSNGSAVYWSSGATGTVTSVATGNGMTGGPVTTTGTVSVLANTGIVANSTGVFVNATYIGTLSANNTTYLNGQLASYYTNATNITTGTLPYAQIPANIVNTTGSFTLSGNTTLAGTNTVISSNLNVTGSFINVASAFVVNSLGAYHTGTINAASHTVGTAFTANATLTNTVSLVVSTNTSTFGTAMYVIASGNVGIGVATPAYTLEVNGAFAATTKSFVINHPSKKGMKLRHGSLEGPENGVYIRGRANTNIIDLPDYWTKLIDKDSITVSLTAIGKTVCPSVGKITNKKINLIGDNIDCFFHVFAERKDVEKLIVEY